MRDFEKTAVDYSLSEPVQVVQAPSDGRWGDDLSCVALSDNQNNQMD